MSPPSLHKITCKKNICSETAIAHNSQRNKDENIQNTYTKFYFKNKLKKATQIIKNVNMNKNKAHNLIVNTYKE